MSILGINSPVSRMQNYVLKGKEDRNSFASNDFAKNEQFQKVNGNQHITLRLGYLHSEGSPSSGQELHMKYDESSTEDDPIMLAVGKDNQGKEFTKKIHLNELDVENASYVEMIALKVHLKQQGDKDVRNSCSIPLTALLGQQDVNTKFNFQQYYNDWISALKDAGVGHNVDMYMSELERYVFYCRMEDKSAI
ncbi:hypothetical protein [Lacrimispora sp.]|uniref:hypothetical protein n=1 Tax=Lacrimispora sp. TaxID=2719234 RepID=UPI002FD89DAC